MHPRQRLTNRTPFWGGDGAKDSHADAGSEASALGLSSPKGAFQARPRPRSFELLKRKRQRQKQHEAKAHWGKGGGSGLPPAPAQGGKCEAFQGFVFSAVARQFYTLVK